MGVRTSNIKKLFADARSRTIIVITSAILLMGIAIGYYFFISGTKGPETKVSLKQTPEGIESVPGSFNPSAEYVKLQEEQNLQKAQQAEKTGGSAIPTIIRVTTAGPGQLSGTSGGVGFQQLAELQEGGTPKGLALASIKQSNCDPASIQRARQAGATLDELRRAGCSASQLLTAGFSPEDLQKAGFSACDLLGTNGLDPDALKKAGYSAGELRGVGFNACQLKKAGFTPEELARAGFTPDELKGVGYSPQEIAAAGIAVPRLAAALAGAGPTTPGLPSTVSASDLRQGGCTPAAVRRALSAGVTAEAMRKITGCTAAELKAGGYSAKQLRDAGFNAAELTNAGFTPAELKDAGFTAKDLVDAGLTPAQLKAAGFTAADLKAAGVPAAALLKAGFTPQELKDAGFTPKDLLMAGLSPDDLKKLGFSDADINAAQSQIAAELPPGVTLAELQNGGCTPAAIQSARAKGVSAKVMREIGCNLKQLKDGGYDLSALRDAGFSPKQLLDAGFTPAELKAAGFTAKELRDAGFTAAQLKALGYTAKDLHDAGFTAAELRKAGFGLSDLKNAGFSAADLALAGFSAADLKAAGFTASDLRTAGFSAKELADAGFTPQELKDAGFSASDMKDAGFTAEQLKNLGYNAGDLISAGFTPQQLKDAGFTAKDLRDAGVSADALKAAGFTAAELRTAGYGADQLKDAGFSDADIRKAGYSPDELANAGVALPGAAGPDLAAVGVTTTRQPTGVEATMQAQQDQVLQQQLQQDTQTLASAMQTQAGQLFDAWKPVTQEYVEGEKKEGATTAEGVPLPPGAVSTGIPTSAGPPLIKAGSLMYGVMVTAVNSDEPGPILARIVSGPLRGAKLIGGLTTFTDGKKVLLNFDTMTLKYFPNSISINAVAVDAVTARTALSDKTNNHYIIRFGSLFAASFLEGYGQAFLQSGQQIVANASSVISNSPNLNPAGKFWVALGNVGNKFGSVLQNVYTMRPTVYVYSGTSIGILFTKDVDMPMETSQPLTHSITEDTTPSYDLAG